MNSTRRRYLSLEINPDLTLSLVGQNLNFKIYNPKNVGLKAIKPKDPIKAAKSVSMLNHFFKYICEERNDDDYDLIANAVMDFFSPRSLNGYDAYVLDTKSDNRASMTLARDYTFSMVKEYLLSDAVLGLMLDYIETYSFNSDFQEDDNYGSILRLEDTYIFTTISVIHKFVGIFTQLLILGNDSVSSQVIKNIKKFTLLNSSDIVETFILDRYPSTNSQFKFVERMQSFIATNSERDVIRNTHEIQNKFIAIGSDVDTIIDAIFSEVISSTGTFSVTLNYNNTLSKAEVDSIVESEKKKYDLEIDSSKTTKSTALADDDDDYIDVDDVDDDGEAVPKKEALNAAKLPYRTGLDYTQFGFNAKNTTGYIQLVRKSASGNNTIKRKFKCIADTYDSEIHSIIQASESVRLDNMKDEELDSVIFEKVKSKLGPDALKYYDDCILNDKIKPNSLSRFVIRQIILNDFGVNLSRMSYASQIAYIIYAQCSVILENKDKLKDAILGGEQSGSVNSTLTIDFSNTPFEYNNKMKSALLTMIRRSYTNREHGTFIPADALASEVEDFIRGI